MERTPFLQVLKNLEEKALLDKNDVQAQAACAIAHGLQEIVGELRQLSKQLLHLPPRSSR